MGSSVSSQPASSTTASSESTPTVVQEVTFADLLSKFPGKTIISLNRKFYDVTDFKYDHPGGSDLLDELHGKDGTDSFNKINHSDSAFALLDKLEIKGYLLAN